ncbi:MAG TPA: response regulator [Gemmatimonadales bacterium]|nr:response regulator [Gemmatimonadales bacterium]
MTAAAVKLDQAVASKGRILLADDEPTFLNATADLLRREGFECVTMPDGPSALEAVHSGDFDLLITDLEMPGNSNLDLVRQIAETSGGLPVIVLTGFPSVRSAVACIELPVAAYLVKPVLFPELLSRVENSVSRFRSYRALESAERRLRDWRREFENVASVHRTGSPLPAPAVDVFLSLTLRNVMGSLVDLDQLGRALSGRTVGENPCQLMNCPRGAQLAAAVRETVRVLEETKSAFKSKALGELRHRLELLLEHV